MRRRYQGETSQHIAYPLGGLGAGCICIEGSGALSGFTLDHKPDIYHEPTAYGVLAVKGGATKVLEGPVPDSKIFRVPLGGHGLAEWHGHKQYGLPRFREAEFSAAFPFGRVAMRDSIMPCSVTLTGWSPFVPGDENRSGLPVAGLEYEFVNETDECVEATFSFHVYKNVFHRTDMGKGCYVRLIPSGFQLESDPGKEDERVQFFSVTCDDKDMQTHCRFVKSIDNYAIGGFDRLAAQWRVLESAEVKSSVPYEDNRAEGVCIYVPLLLQPKEKKCVRLQLSWYTPESDMSAGSLPVTEDPRCYKPYYSVLFENSGVLSAYWLENYQTLRDETVRFTEAFLSSTLPEIVMEAVEANLSILKSPTILRQHDGRMWAWEGVGENFGSCHGSCTHVWNYAQAVAHLFPGMERSLRETEFGESQNEEGRQSFRSSLPIRTADFDYYPASDGQLGGILKVYRDWRISGDSMWLRAKWPLVKKSLDYCISIWDIGRKGILFAPHHNTYDIEFWGPDGMCGSIYLGALSAASKMAKFLGEDAERYDTLFEKGKVYLENELFNGTFFFQKVEKDDFAPPEVELDEATSAIYREEGPSHQYGKGLLSDGVIGAWMAQLYMNEEILDSDKVKSHLSALYRHNLKKDLTDHVNVQRSGYALGNEGGLLLCTWPMGEKPTMPFIYSDEVWTGIEYQVASHMLLMGLEDYALEVIQTCRGRYAGKRRNPFDEYECGHWYARALSSYSLLQAYSGIFYDAVSKVLRIAPRIQGDFRCFFSTETGYGCAGVKNDEPFVEVLSGEIPYSSVEYCSWSDL